MDDVHLEPRRHNTSRKSIWLTDEAKAAIQHWADANQTSFSAAIETLARLGMQEPAATAMAPMIVSVIRQSVSRQMERFAKLSGAAAIQSGIGLNLSRAALRLAVQNRARARPDGFEDTIFMVDEEDPAEQAYRRIYRNAVGDAVGRLKSPLEALLAPPPALQERPDNGDR